MQNTLKVGYNELYNITIESSGKLDVCIPVNKRVLLLDGRYIPILNNDFGRVVDGEYYKPNSMAMNVTWEEFKTFSTCVKLTTIKKILPRVMTNDEMMLLEKWEREEWDIFYKQCADHFEKGQKPKRNDSTEAYELYLKYESLLYKYRNNNAIWMNIFIHHEKEMSIECFNSILEHCGKPNYIIVTNDFVYEHLPSEGKPKDIHTSEGIVEAWEINGVTMFYMPLTGNMSEEDILLWRTVLTEVLV